MPFRGGVQIVARNRSVVYFLYRLTLFYSRYINQGLLLENTLRWMDCQEVWKPEFWSAVELLKISGVKKINFTDYLSCQHADGARQSWYKTQLNDKASLAWRWAYWHTHTHTAAYNVLPCLTDLNTKLTGLWNVMKRSKEFGSKKSPLYYFKFLLTGSKPLKRHYLCVLSGYWHGHIRKRLDRKTDNRRRCNVMVAMAAADFGDVADDYVSDEDELVIWGLSVGNLRLFDWLKGTAV